MPLKPVRRKSLAKADHFPISAGREAALETGTNHEIMDLDERHASWIFKKPRGRKPNGKKLLSGVSQKRNALLAFLCCSGAPLSICFGLEFLDDGNTFAWISVPLDCRSVELGVRQRDRSEKPF